MINFEYLNSLIYLGGLFIGLCYVLLLFFASAKISDYKVHKNLEQKKTDKQLELYYLLKKLVCVKNSNRKTKILTKINNLENDISLIDNINWGLDYEKKDS